MEMIYSLIPIVSMAVGFYFGYRIGKDKEIPKVELNPVKAIVKNVEDKREREQAKKEEQEINDFLSNIDNFPHNQIKIKE